MYQERYMRRAIELAKKGIGAVNPNPLVGAVIVKDGRIIGEGYHARYGELHAERHAFANLTEDAEGAEMYVTLEPCCHVGKQPPCVEAIVEHKISHVFVGSDDPNEKVAGKGIEYLRTHGIKVTTQVLKSECDDINRPFFHYITNKTPYVVMKYAMTMDGKIAAYTGESKWITNEVSRQMVQESRNEYVGIMVGIGTVLADDPMLTCRIKGGRNPIRIICDTNLRIPMDSNIVKTAREVPTIIATANKHQNDNPDKIKTFENAGVTVLQVGLLDEKIDLKELMIFLGQRKIDSILLEGGGNLNYSALMQDIVSEVHMYVAPKILGGKDALTPVEGIGVDTPSLAKLFELKSVEKVFDDIQVKYLSKNRFRMPEAEFDKEEFEKNWNIDRLKDISVEIGSKTTTEYTTCCFYEDGQWHIGGINEGTELTVVCSGDEKYIFTKLDKLIRLKISLREQCGIAAIEELMDKLT
ncbi:MAG: bifunctional diaminohydroxyphosphoribosylaminopyrimidine deaminase/5-amino-6-(5-phosphoribosylamino)uracil reductase RibD [Lachnospiraceae bacterium]|nr:bifunctional diaminohydroxyphosphoribosylaminopyrimidine deaminase/5-amino-6-(5-phosphoribosylamino)uracil reductase RibD [Lachnospiraceae bacterium]